MVGESAVVMGRIESRGLVPQCSLQSGPVMRLLERERIAARHRLPWEPLAAMLVQRDNYSSPTLRVFTGRAIKAESAFTSCDSSGNTQQVLGGRCMESIHPTSYIQSFFPCVDQRAVM